MTSYFQYVIFDKIKFGLAILFRCINCYHNVYERLQFVFGLVQTSSDEIPFIYCPYCGDKVYALEAEPGGYELLFTVDQSSLVTLTVQLMGTASTAYTITWGDYTLSTGSFDGTLQSFTHDYNTEGDYYVKIFVNTDDLIQLRIDNENLKDSCPVFSQFGNLTQFLVNSNSLTGTMPTISACTSLQIVNVNDNNMSGDFPDWSSVVTLEQIRGRNNSFTGSLYSFAALSSLRTVVLNDNQFTGGFPDISANLSLIRIILYNNQLSGTVPAFGANTVLDRYFISDNAGTGTFPAVTSLTALTWLRAANNSFAGFSASTIALTCVWIDFSGNALVQGSVDQVLSDVNDNLASRPASGQLYLQGGTNATPSAQGLIYKANIIAHGWTVLTN